MNLFKHQKDIIDKDPKKCGLFLGTGSSKTRIALELAQGNVLVICPKTQKEDDNWGRENKKWNINKHVVVISKETFRRDAHALPRFDTVIGDEVHTMLGVTPNIRWKNKQPIPKTSQLFEEFDTYIKRTNPERIYLCTATIMKSPMTVWGAAKILGYNFDFYHFRNKFYIQLPMPGRQVFASKKDSQTKNELAKLVKGLGYTGRLEDYFDVPTQTKKVVHVELTAKQKQRIKELPLEYPDPIVLCGKKHQVENGILSGDEYNEKEEFENEKLEKIVDFAVEFPKIVIFAKYRAQIEQIRARLVGEGYNVLTLTGDTKDRGKVILEANNSSECIFIAQAQVSSGWELPDFPVMIFASMSYSFVDRVQGEGRILRANALKKNLYIDLVVKGGIDDAVYKCIEEKKDFDERLYLKL